MAQEFAQRCSCRGVLCTARGAQTQNLNPLIPYNAIGKSVAPDVASVLHYVRMGLSPLVRMAILSLIATTVPVVVLASSSARMEQLP